MAKGFDRRRFLAGGCAAVSLAACGGPPPTGSGDGTGETGTTPGPDTGPDADPYPCEQVIDPVGPGWTALPLSQYPDLANVGGWYGVQAGGGIVVAHVTEGCYAAIARSCAHEGEPIDYIPARGQFVCPRHAAIYSVQGDKVGGPAPTGLPVYPAGRVGDTVWVRTS